jgi:anti-sigma factor RsiW
MDCGEARKILYVSEELQALTPDLAEAQEHINSCTRCGEFFKMEENIKDLLRKRAPKVKASASLREDILNMLAKQKTTRNIRASLLSNRFKLRASLVLLGVVLVLFFMNLSYNPFSNDEPLSIASRLAEDHLRNIPEAVQILSSDPKTIEDWFKDKVDFVVRVPELRGAKLRGGRLCHIDNIRTALLFYEKDGEPISLFIIDESHLDRYSADKFEILDKGLHKDTKKGCNLIFWRQRGILYALVSDIDTKELSYLVTEVALRE